MPELVIDGIAELLLTHTFVLNRPLVTEKERINF
jgi:hypothetical protein